MFRTLLAAAGLAVTLVGTAAPGLAQSGDLSEEEILRRFQGQMTDLGPTRSLSATPAPEQPVHRGLVIAPAAEVANPAATSPQQVQVVPVEYTPAAVENQVNIQISFDFDSAALRDDQASKLVTMCNAMKQLDIPQFRIIGHTDSAGAADYNDNLSLLRAEEVRRKLIADCGIAPERLQAIGVGQRYPANAANPRADENRRVEFQAVS